MKFALHILSAPYVGQGCVTALQFAHAAIAQGHQIPRVFFSGEAVAIGNNLITPAQGDLNLHQAWADFARDHHSELILCISASLKRGLLDAGEAERYEKPAHCVAAPFELSGLGQLVEAGLLHDHLITFAG